MGPAQIRFRDGPVAGQPSHLGIAARDSPSTSFPCGPLREVLFDAGEEHDVQPVALTLAVLIAAIVCFTANLAPVGVVAVGCSLALLACGLVDTKTTLSGFGDPVVIFIATLFVVAEGLDASGLTAWVGRRIADSSGSSRLVLVPVVLVTTALLGALITPNGAAVAMIPVVLAVARAGGLRPGTLLMPVAFAASAGALLTLSGSVVNVMVSQEAQTITGRGFGFFEFAGAGVFLVVGTVLVTLVAGRLVPAGEGGQIARDFGSHLDTLLHDYDIRRGFSRLRVGSRFDPGSTARDLEARGAEVYAVQGPDGGVRGLDDGLEQGDLVLVAGEAPRVDDLSDVASLVVEHRPLTADTRDRMVHDAEGLAEVIVPPRSMLAGKRFVTGMRRGDITVLGLRRGGRDVGTRAVRLAEGDTLLLHGPWAAIHQLEESDDIVLVDSPEALRRQIAPLGTRAVLAGSVTLVMVVLLATGVVTPAVAGLIGAVGMVLLRVITPNEAYRAISWQTVVLIGGMIPLSVAIRTSGTADLLADGVVHLVGGGHQVLVLAVVFVVTAFLGQVVSNTATALIMIPIVVSIAQASGIDVRMMLMSLAVAAGASLITPIATPANMMVGAAAGYRFQDYWRFGGVTMVVWFAVAVFLVPIIWS